MVHCHGVAATLSNFHPLDETCSRNGGIIYMEQTLQTVTGQNSLAIWAERVRACRSSGLAVKTWCAENGIVPNTYFRWQKKVFNAACLEQGEFYEVPLTAPRSMAVVSVEVNGITAKVFHGADEETIRSVLLAMRSC